MKNMIMTVINEVESAKLVNLTPHAVNIVKATGSKMDLAPTGNIARCSQSNEMVGSINGIAITRQVFGDVVGLPEPQEGTLYVVSRLVAAACPERNDLVIPGPLLRDTDGRIVGCDGLSIL